MGANQSTQPRSVNLDNQNPVGVIDVSEEVVERIKSGLLKDKQKKSAVTVTVPTQKLPNEHQQFVTPPTVSQPATHSNTHYQQSGIKYIEPSVSSFDIRRQKELELQQNDAYWRKRFSQLEQSLKKTNTIMEKEYSSTIEDVRKRFLAAPSIHQLSPCQALKVRLIACYRFNAGETLKCSDEVAAFANCVCEERLKKLDPQPIIEKPTGVDGIPAKSDDEYISVSNSSPPKGA